MKVLDDENVHQFWGISPSIDYQQAYYEASTIDQKDVSEEFAAALHVSRDMEAETPICVLQACVYDCRHVLRTICQSSRQAGPDARRPVVMYVFEEEVEGLARQMLLISIMLDAALPAKDRMETLLEVHSNALLQDKTAEYVETKGRELEDLIASSGIAESRSATLGHLFDMSHIKFQERDQLAEVFRGYRRKSTFDIAKAWDTRSRKFYEDRYDFRRNMVDWDYTMRLQAQGTPGLDPQHGSIIHSYHFRTWRETGIAYELRDCKYSAPNRTLVSTAVGRTREFKDRNGADRGRSVAARGFWGDILNSPYHCFGTRAAEEPALLRISNKQFVHTAVDVAQHNVTAMLHELRTGTRYERQPERAKTAAGPTSLEDLEQACAPERGEDPSQKPVEGSTSVHASCTIAELSTHANEASGGVHDSAAEDPAAQKLAAAEAQAAELRAHEAELDKAAAQRCKRFKLVLMTGNLSKVCTSKPKNAGRFDVISIGHRHVHFLNEEHQLAAAAAPGACLLVENAKYMLQLNEEQVAKFEGMIVEKAHASGWTKLEHKVDEVTAAHTVFVKPKNAASAMS